jgi:uncharacterized repeat protein (TIGR01451 family)
MHRVPARLAVLTSVVSLITVWPLSPPAPAAANHMVDLTVRITKIADLGGDLDDGAADLYVGVNIDGQVFSSFNNIAVDVDTRTFTGGNNVAFVKSVPLVRSDDRPALIPVSLSVWDHDTCSDPFCDDQLNPADDDDKGDTLNGPGDEVTIFVDPISGTWSGGVSSPTTCSTGELGNDVQSEVCWAIETGAPDSDGDGLLDDWEINGLDLDHAFPPEVNLPLMGANPNRKDIFLELDYTPGQAPARDDIRAMVRAFDAAGISLHVDIGDLSDPSAVEGQAEGTCMDGLNNGGDAAQDGADPDCFNQTGTRQYLETSTEDPPPLVGGVQTCGDGNDNNGANGADGSDPTCRVSDFRDFAPDGGGQVLDNNGNPAPALFNCGVDATFYMAKNGGGAFSANFNPNRRWVFHYAISTANDIDTDGMGPDTDTCATGGQGEIGGNDFIEYNHDGGTIMHELGHNLNLQHGGNDSNNCEPNYVSVMNYDNQFGIQRAGGGAILDYSPPRLNVTGATRGVVPAAVLFEGDLDETVVLDPTDAVNLFAFTNMNPATGVVQKLTNNLNAGADYNGDGDALDNRNTQPNPPNNPVVANINTAGVPPGSPAGTAASPPSCANALSNETLNGHHDWNALDLLFLKYGDSLTRALLAEQDHVSNMQDRDVLLAALNTADLGVTVTDSPDPVGAGERLTYTVSVTNAGPNRATSTEVRTTLPADVVFVDTSVWCVRAANVVTCNLGELLPGATRTFTIRADVPPDLTFLNGGPKTITALAAVDNLAGPDPNPANDSESEDTLVITKADVKITGLATSPPLEVLIGQPASATVAATIENGGPSTPVDTILTSTATSTGLTITPASTSSAQDALAVGAPRTVSQTYQLSCTSPGFRVVQLSYSLALKDPTALDPDLTNNVAATSFTIDCVVPMVINVRPQGFPNSINLNTDATVAALTTRAGEYGLPLAFDATKIDPLTALWGVRSKLFNVATPRGAPEIHSAGHLERSYELDERTRDADVDMVLHYKPSQSGLTKSSKEACLKGSYLAPDGNTYRFLGCDSVKVVS